MSTVIFSENICPGDICQYNHNPSCYWSNFDQTFGTQFFAAISQLLMTRLWPDFWDPNFFGAFIFVEQHFFGKTYFDPNIFCTKNFLDLNFVYLNCFGRIFLYPNFFLIKNFLDSKIFWPRFSWTKLFFNKNNNNNNNNNSQNLNGFWHIWN